jgi:hypothetical protein
MVFTFKEYRRRRGEKNQPMIKKDSLNHNYYLNLIKKITKASYVGWIDEKGSKTLRVVIDKKENLLPLIGGDITIGTYTQLISSLIGVTEDKINYKRDGQE